ncbi:MAG: DinB family protein [Planctomycetota bacterium]
MDFSIRPGDHECFDYHRDYVAKVPDGDIRSTLVGQQESIPSFIESLDDAVLSMVHEPYHWSIRTVIEHCCDAERVFGYRILRFAAGDQTDLPGWDESTYASSGYSQARSKVELANEYSASRASNLALLSRIQPESLDRIGTADGRKMSVRTIVWLMAGHWIHHHGILEARLSG